MLNWAECQLKSRITDLLYISIQVDGTPITALLA